MSDVDGGAGFGSAPRSRKGWLWLAAFMVVVGVVASIVTADWVPLAVCAGVAVLWVVMSFAAPGLQAIRREGRDRWNLSGDDEPG